MNCSKNNALVFVVTHKKFDDSIVPKGYQVIKVGTQISENEALRSGYLTDETGDNISEKNPYYCELTAHYWVWKNTKDIDYIGISHYRRFFMDYSRNSSSFKDNILSASKVCEIMGNYRAILPFWDVKTEGRISLFKGVPREKQSPNWIILQDILQEHYPHVMPAFNKILYGKKTIYFNMMVLSKPDFDEYSEFLFGVLGLYDQEILRRGILYAPRVDGYLSETLLPVWTTYKYKESEIYRTDVMNSEQMGWTCKTFVGRLRVFHPVLSIVRRVQLLLSIVRLYVFHL